MNIKELTNLLQATGEAHHEAYLAVNGVDPEWPLWYATYLRDDLNAGFDQHFTRSEIIYLLVKLDKDYTNEQADIPWAEYYARYLVETFGK